MTEPLISALREFLGTEGLEFFRDCLDEFGTVAPVIPCAHNLFPGGSRPNSPLPVHPVHFREGMTVRNWLRGRPETLSWSDHDYDNKWVALVEAAVDLPEISSN